MTDGERSEPRVAAQGQAESVILEADGIVAGYGELNILHGVSVSLGAGEMVAGIGPNGAGKSTLLRTLFGLLAVREGSGSIKEEDVTGRRPDQMVRRGVSYVPQGDHVCPSLTVTENL